MKKLIIFSVLICFSFSFPKTLLVLEEISPNPQITAKPEFVTPKVSVPKIISGEIDQPPPFGTIVQQWTLNMGGTYQGAGITWRQDSGRFYLMAQGKRVYSFKPENVYGTFRQERWNFQSVGGNDIPFGLAWDADSLCFWISHIANMNSGCWLYRYIYDLVADSWEWAGTPRDSWNITDSLIPRFGGMVKNCNTGYFWFASIPIRKLDFYHKTQVGQCETGSGHGIAWIDCASNYVITSQWYSPYLTERDTFGNILQQNNTYYGYVDCEFWDKLLPNPYDTVFLFIIASDANNTLYKVSTGMRWRQLKSGVILEAILSPTTGSYESGSVITPSAIICNWSLTNVSEIWSRFWIFRQSDSLLVYQDSIFTSRLVPFERDTLIFTPFQLSIPPGNYIAKCSIMGSPAKEVVFSIHVFDVRVLGIVNPPSTVNFGDLIVPQAWVRNYGTMPESFWVMCRIPPAYRETVFVANLMPDSNRLVSFPVWLAGPPGRLVVTCSIIHPRGRSLTKEVTVIGGGDVGITEILMPADTMYCGTFNPIIRLQNFGYEDQTPECIFHGFNSLGTEIYCDTQETTVLVGEIVDLEFDRYWSIDSGNYSCFAERFYPPDQIPENDTLSKFFFVKSVFIDLMIVCILGNIRDTIWLPDTVTMGVQIRNLSSTSVGFWASCQIFDSLQTEVYWDTVEVVNLQPNSTINIFFDPWFPPGPGWYQIVIKILYGEPLRTIDSLNISVVAIESIPATNWQAMASIPIGVSGKRPKSGSCMAGLISTGKIYFLKASNSQDFHIYTPDPDTGTWTANIDDTIPLGTKPEDGKRPKGGAAMAAYQPKKCVYVLRGNNTQGFWQYQADTLTGDTITVGWKKMKEIPRGSRAPRAGSGLVAIAKEDKDYIFAMKGSKTDEFYLYDIAANAWMQTAKPPTGPSGRAGYKGGSCLAYDGDSFVYVLKGSYGDFFKYKVSTDSWYQLRRYDYKSFLNRYGIKKKPKDGAGLVYYDNNVYMLKGGNTREFWKYDIAADDWAQMDERWDIPIGTGKKVRSGSGLIRFNNHFYISKGANTVEFYRLSVQTTKTGFMPNPVTPEGAMENKLTLDEFKVLIAPNPARTYLAIRLPQSVNRKMIKIFDVSGKLVKVDEVTGAQSHKQEIRISLKGINPGIYFLRLGTETRKFLVVR